MIQYTEKDFRLAERFCAAAAGTDLFYRNLPAEGDKEDSFRREGLVPVDFSGVKPLSVESWEQALAELDEICKGYEEIPAGPRQNYMLQQVGSFRKVCRWLSGAPFSFRELAAETMFLDANPVPQKVITAKTRRMYDLLGEAGFSGDVQERFAAWKKSRLADGPEAVEQILKDLLAEAKEKTLSLGMDAIEDFNVEARVVFDVPYNAYCDYFTRSIWINGTVTYTVDELKHLVCHEAYPGHMTHMANRQRLLEAGKIPADAGMVITNTASSPIFEGLADNGMAVLEWDNSLHDQICLCLSQIQSICNVNASYLLHTGAGGAEAAREYLRNYSFSSEAQIDARIRYMSYPFRKAYMYPYWRGWDAVRSVWLSLAAENKKPFLDYLYNHMHSIDTVRQFQMI